MKKQTLAALLAASLTAWVSCDQPTKSEVANPLIGQWKIDSIAAPDSIGFGVLLLASTLRDSAAYDLAFTADSISLLQKDTVTKSGYAFDHNKNQLVLKEDSAVFTYQPIDSSMIKLTATDSTTIFLRKSIK